MRLGGEYAEEATRVLCEAFADYPVMRYVLRDAADGYVAGLRRLVGFFVMARVLRGEPILGIVDGSSVSAVALVSLPEVRSPPGLRRLREDVWRQLGPAARARYEAFGAMTARLSVDAPHIHLNMIGVGNAHRGRGLARTLLEEVHALSRATEGSRGVTLTTESPANIPLYRHFGYELVGRARVAPDLETWSFFRPDHSQEREVEDRAD